jgi:hypothetical protein
MSKELEENKIDELDTLYPKLIDYFQYRLSVYVVKNFEQFVPSALDPTDEWLKEHLDDILRSGKDIVKYCFDAEEK